MSTIAKVPQPARVASKPATTLSGNEASYQPSMPEPSFLFDKDNYIWMIGGIALIFIGFFLLAGGKSANPHEFHYDEIYSFRRLTLAPLVMMAGFIVEVFAIMRKPKTSEA